MASLPGASPFSPGMAVISCYERLRMEIQALITENKELRKLVDLMKENQDLKNVLRNQSLGGEMSLSTLASTRSSEREQSGILGPASTDSVPHSASPWDTTLNDTVFSDDMPLLPQSAISPASRAAPVSFQMPPTPQDPQRPPDVRPKEMTRKVFRATDRPQTQGATSKPNLVKDHNQLTWERIVGEIAFQLDRRILSSIFPERVRLYGFTVNNIPEKIIQASTNTLSNQVDEQQCTAMTRRYLEIMNRLKAAGYNPCMHPSFTEYIVNTYGILRERPELAASESGSYNNVDFLRKVVMETVPDAVRDSALILLECLAQLAKDDGKPMFIW
ncbi:speriolin isoform X3 [Mauremys reevesii]|uniref:speriolin isoform X3 n=1 Tax=Mauremys reevesii TaxID=260615 RepID=UPI00193FED15|nr:speriolin isoform X3 [Mauremys reevesii]